MHVERIFIFSIIIILITISIVVLVGYLVKKHKRLVKTYQSLFVGVLAVVASTIASIALMYGYYHDARSAKSINDQNQFLRIFKSLSSLKGEMMVNLINLDGKIQGLKLDAHPVNILKKDIKFSHIAFDGLASTGELGDVGSGVLVSVYNAYNWLEYVDENVFSKSNKKSQTADEIRMDMYTACYSLVITQGALSRLISTIEKTRLTSTAHFNRENTWFEYGKLEVEGADSEPSFSYVPSECEEFKDWWPKVEGQSDRNIPKS